MFSPDKGQFWLTHVTRNKQEDKSSHDIVHDLNEGLMTHDFIFEMVSFVKVYVLSEADSPFFIFKAKGVAAMISKKNATIWSIQPQDSFNQINKKHIFIFNIYSVFSIKYGVEIRDALLLVTGISQYRL